MFIFFINLFVFHCIFCSCFVGDSLIKFIEISVFCLCKCLTCLKTDDRIGEAMTLT